MNAPAKRYRVAQWATGNVGSRALRHIIDHPDMDLAGVWVHSADKAGRDAGDLCGRPATGIAATNSIEDIIAAKPDCVLYMPHLMNYDEVCRLLESGANIITTRTEFQYPAVLDSAVRARVEDACKRGNASIHGTGSSPGFISEALPIVLASLQRRLECLTIYEFADNSSRNSPEMLFDVMGFGSDPAAGPNPHILAHLKEAFGGTLRMTAEALGMPFDSIEVRGGLGVARKDTQIAAGLVPAGTVAATRTVISGIKDGQPLMKMITTWYVSDDIDTTDGEEWVFRDSGWRVLVEGDCPMDVQIRFPVAEENYAAMTPGLTANRPINTVPTICAAEPGIRTTADLPQVIASLSKGTVDTFWK